jgi:hypothetical protein
MSYKFGPNGHIIDAFYDYVRRMSEEKWFVFYKRQTEPYEWVKASRRAVRCAMDAVGEEDAEGAWGVMDRITPDNDMGYAANEIQGADLMRERGLDFYFLPLFGFADEKAILEEPVK